MDIKIYNSLTNKLEKFTSIKENEISMYVCGPTVYNHIHIGNARPVVFFDMVARFFTFLNYKVTYVTNFTDIDDKIIKVAIKEQVKESVISERYIDSFMNVCQKLNCLPFSQTPRVTLYMKQIGEYIKELKNLGYAYQVGDNVYFRVTKAKDYGILSNQKLDDLDIGNRIEKEDDKEDPRDFVLWKLTSDTGVKWDSPFGMGRPGWHTECCVMIDDIFKGMIDIHGGGNDLKFPHHENEIAQAIAKNGNTIANFWVHNARVDLDGEKMSKSLGNVIYANELLDKVAPQVLRLLLLSNNYRQIISYKEELTKESITEWEKIDRAYTSLYRYLELNGTYLPSKKWQNKNIDFASKELTSFENEIANDFNTTNALTILYQMLKDINIKLRAKDINYQEMQAYLYSFNGMLYILGLEPTVKELSTDEKQLVMEHLEARKNKDYNKADELRKKINELGITL